MEESPCVKEIKSQINKITFFFVPKEQPNENSKVEAACIKKQKNLYVSSLQVAMCQSFLSACASVEGIFLLSERERSCRFHVHTPNAFKTKLAASDL